MQVTGLITRKLGPSWKQSAGQTSTQSVYLQRIQFSVTTKVMADSSLHWCRPAVQCRAGQAVSQDRSGGGIQFGQGPARQLAHIRVRIIHRHQYKGAPVSVADAAKRADRSLAQVAHRIAGTGTKYRDSAHRTQLAQGIHGLLPDLPETVA